MLLGVRGQDERCLIGKSREKSGVGVLGARGSFLVPMMGGIVSGNSMAANIEKHDEHDLTGNIFSDFDTSI